MKELFENVVKATGKNFTCEKSISGYYRLMCDGDIIHDDSACEEVNDTEEKAMYFFASILMEEYVPAEKKKFYHGGWMLV